MTGVATLLTDDALVVLGVRMLLVAGFVVLIAVLAERLGPFLGGMVASLPLYTGPVYLMLALEHDTAWLVRASLGSLAITGASPVFVLGYCVLAPNHGVGVSLAGAALGWIACALAIQSVEWTVVTAGLFVAPIYVVAVLLAGGFTRGIAVARAPREWTDLLLRALLVAVLSGFTIGISGHVPAQIAGILSVAPVLTSSLAMVLHPRIGGLATAALLAHTLSGLVGMAIAFAVVHTLLAPVGVVAALSLGLLVTVMWNLMLIALSHHRRKTA